MHKAHMMCAEKVFFECQHNICSINQKHPMENKHQIQSKARSPAQTQNVVFSHSRTKCVIVEALTSFFFFFYSSNCKSFPSHLWPHPFLYQESLEPLKNNLSLD